MAYNNALDLPLRAPPIKTGLKLETKKHEFLTEIPNITMIFLEIINNAGIPLKTDFLKDFAILFR